MAPASAPARPEGPVGMMSANAARSGAPSNRAASWAPGDSGPNLYSNIPSRSEPRSPASASASFAATSASDLGFGSPALVSSEYPTPTTATSRASEVITAPRRAGIAAT